MPFDSPEVWARRRNGGFNDLNLRGGDRMRSTDLGLSSRERWRYVIRGQVQGVGYRAACNRRASELGLSGWVRNCSDGCVEVQAEGTEQQLIALRVWCESGPSEARVASVLASRIPPTGADWFEVRPDLRGGDGAFNPRSNQAP